MQGNVTKLMDKSLKIKTPMSRYSDVEVNKTEEKAKLDADQIE